MNMRYPGCYFKDGSTISRCPLLNIFASEENIPLDVLEVVDCQGHLTDGNKKMEHSFVINF